MSNNWYVVTGGPSVGKTTLLEELSKMGYTVLPEAARTVIDKGIENGLTIEQIRGDERQFQMDVLDMKLRVEKATLPDQVTFFDRGMHDTIAYLQIRDIKIDSHVLNACAQSHYQKVFLLDPLPQFEKDYARVESKASALKLNDLLYEAYAEYGMTPIHVPVMLPEKRTAWVLQHINEPTTLNK